MNDEDALKLLREMLENARKTTNNHPNLVFGIFSDFVGDLTRISSHIQNENLRICSIRFLELLRDPFRGYFNHTFQNLVIEKLKASLEKEGEIRKEIILNAASRSLSVLVFSDNDGRDVVDIGRLRRDLEGELRDLEEPTKLLILLKISNAIREIYDKPSFIEESKEEMLKFYDELINKKDWQAVYSVLLDYLINWDKKAIVWMREKVDV